jgi:long-chain acyl-CoA synthetase
VRRALGGRLRLLVTGGAPCPAPLLYAFRRLGLPIIEGYGLTEAAPVVSLSTARRARPGSVGYALPNITVRLDAPDAQGVGELQVRGPMVMRGYYRNPEATALAFDGEWLRTGDLASIAADGYIAIRGRVKALIVNREGKNIYPEEVESSIAAHPLVRDVVVIGVRDGGEVGEKVGAIVVPNLEGWEAATGAPPPEWEAVEARLRQLVQTQCRELADYKRPRRVEVRREPLERTAIQKVRRHLYQGQLDNR